MASRFLESLYVSGAVGVCTTKSYARKWIVKLCSCWFCEACTDTAVNIVSRLLPGRARNCGLLAGRGKGCLLQNIQTSCEAKLHVQWVWDAFFFSHG